jgi:hypothetical protein
LRIGSVLAEAGDRAIDQFRIDPLQAVVIEAVFGKAADLEILDDDIGFGGEFADQLLAARRRHVDEYRGFAAVGGEEIGGIAAAAVGVLDEGRTPAARVVAFAGFLDLDHLGAEIGEQLRRPGPGENAGEIENADVGKRAGHGGLRSEAAASSACPPIRQMLGMRRRLQGRDRPWPKP